MKKFLVVDDHSIVRSGIKMILYRLFPGAECAEAINEKSAIALVKDHQFDLIFLDLNMPQSDPETLIHFVINKRPNTRIIILTMNDENVYAKRFFKLGIKGFLNKSADDEEIETAIHTVLHGGTYLSDQLKKILAESFISGKSDNPFDKLSSREFQVARELLKGKSIPEISGSLNIHPSTVSSYKTKVFEKLAIPHYNLVELIEAAKTYNVI